MDINDFRGIMTALVFIAFIGISVWAYSRQSASAFEQMSRLPLEDEADNEEEN